MYTSHTSPRRKRFKSIFPYFYPDKITRFDRRPISIDGVSKRTRV